MGVSDIILRAILDTNEIETAISKLDTKTFKQKFAVGDSIRKDFENQFQILNTQAKTLAQNAHTAKTDNIFGNPEAIKRVGDEYIKVRNEFNSTTTALDKFARTYELTKAKLTKQFKLPDAMKQLMALEGMSGTKLTAIMGAMNAKGSQAGLYQNLVMQGTGVAPKDIKDYLTSTEGKNFTAAFNALDTQSKTLEKVKSRVAGVKTELELAHKTISSSQSAWINFFNNVGVAGNSMAEIFGKLAGKVATWLVATTGIFAVIGAFKALGTETKAIQDSQTNLQRILQGTPKEMAVQMKATMEFARAMNILAGASYTETIKSMETIIKAGFSLAESMEIAKAAMLAANVSELNFDDSSRYLISTLRQFNLTANDSVRIINQWNEVGQRSAAETRDIAEVVIRAGSAFKLAGGSLEQLNAIAASTVEATGESGDIIGTMIKTFSARYADINSKGGFFQTLMGNKKLKIDYYNEATGKFDSMYKTLGKLRDNWDRLTEAEQAHVAKAAVGLRQYNRFVGMMKEYDRSVGYLAVALDSQNSAITENSRRWGTLDFNLRRLKGTFSELTQSIIIQIILQSVTKVVQLLTLTFNGLALMLKSTTGTMILFSAVALTVAGSIKAVYNAVKILMTISTLSKIFGAVTALFNPFVLGGLAVIATLAGVGIAIDKLKNKSSQKFSVDFLNGISEKQKNLKSLQDNLEQFIKVYNKTNDISIKSNIVTVFKDLANIDLSKLSKQGLTSAQMIQQATIQLKGLTSETALLKDLTSNIYTSWFSRFWDTLKHDLPRALQWAVGLFGKFGEFIWSVIKIPFDKMSPYITKTFNFIAEIFDKVVGALKKIPGAEALFGQLSVIKNGVIDILKMPYKALTEDGTETIKSVIKTKSGEYITTTLERKIPSLSTQIGALTDKFLDYSNAAFSNLTGYADTTKNYINDYTVILGKQIEEFKKTNKNATYQDEISYLQQILDINTRMTKGAFKPTDTKVYNKYLREFLGGAKDQEAASNAINKVLSAKIAYLQSLSGIQPIIKPEPDDTGDTKTNTKMEDKLRNEALALFKDLIKDKIKLNELYLKKQYDAEYLTAKHTYERIKKEYESMKKDVTNIVKGGLTPLLEVNSDNSLSERVAASFAGMRKSIFENLTTDITQSITDGIIGAEPANLPEQLKTAYDDIVLKERINSDYLIDGMNNSTSLFVDALDTWVEKFSIFMKTGEFHVTPKPGTSKEEQKATLDAKYKSTLESIGLLKLDTERELLGLNKIKLDQIGPEFTKSIGEILKGETTTRQSKELDDAFKKIMPKESSDKYIPKNFMDNFSNKALGSKMQEWTKQLGFGGEGGIDLSGMFKPMQEWFSKAFKNIDFSGMMLGGQVGAMMSQVQGKSSMFGMLGGSIGALFGPWGALAGGLLGSLFDQSNTHRDVEQTKDETIKNSKESLKELKNVNHNLTKMIDQMNPYSMSESYYFSVSNSRGVM